MTDMVPCGEAAVAGFCSPHAITWKDTVPAMPITVASTIDLMDIFKLPPVNFSD
jgi:hypothetical protein